ncbi:HEXXH motif domain-containing protein [Actinoplanes sp. NPDC051851]|uniref:HEXXH motif domain-containing protein n=1 Tax=Actinoplanes sp. NPDC051851 TaxID=3154753 RepID=UPI003420A68A
MEQSPSPVTALAERHRLSSAQLTSIAWGMPGPQVIDALYAADTSRLRLLAAHVLRQNGAAAGPGADALAVLDAAQRRDPIATAAVLRSGWLGAWTARMLDHAPADTAHHRLGVLATAAARHTGIRTELRLPVLGGSLHFPTLGTVSVPGAETGSVAVVRVDSGLHIDVAGTTVDEAGSRWDPVRALTAQGIRLLVDDRDPCRDSFDVPPCGPLPDAEFARWQTAFREAWSLLRRHVPAMAAQVGGGLRVLVPLGPPSTAGGRSVSCVDALGTLAATTPEDGISLALTLVHEWSHSLLNGLLEFTVLSEPGSPATYFAPWRPDPRPLLGVLHGTFAFLAVTETLRSFLAADIGGEPAGHEFALRRAQLAEVLETLADVPGLTPQGQRFVAVLRHRSADLAGVAVRPEYDATATARIAVSRAAWARRREGEPS